MRLYIKNMVCSRCIMLVRQELEKSGLIPVSVDLGEVDIKGDPSKRQLSELDLALRHLGFEIIDDKKSRIIEKIKNAIIAHVHHSKDKPGITLSLYLTDKLHYDYSYLSNLFSDVEGTTIEKYYISQKIEKIKELLVYDELSLSEIADKMGYNSAAYLSNQFKKVTGLTPSYYRSLKEHKRRNIEEL